MLNTFPIVKECQECHVLRANLFLDKYKLTYRAPSHTRPSFGYKGRGSFPCKFPLYHFSIAHRNNRARGIALSDAPTLSPQVCFRKNSPPIFGYTYTHARILKDLALTTYGTFTATAGCTNQPTFIGFYRATHSPIFFYYDEARV